MAKQDPVNYDPRSRPRIILFSVIGLVLVGAVAFLFVLPRIPAVKAWRADQLARKAIEAMDSGDWAKAHAKTIAAYQLSPANPQAIRAAARLNAAAGMPQALGFYRSLLESQQAEPDDYIGYAEALLRSGSYPPFLTALAEAERQAPGDPRLQLLTARYAFVAGDSPSVSRILGGVLSSGAATPAQKALAAEILFATPLPESRLLAANWLLDHSTDQPDSRVFDSILASSDLPEDLRARAAAAVEKLPGRRFEGRIEVAASQLRADPSKKDQVFDELIREVSSPDDRRALGSFFVQARENKRAVDLISLSLARSRKDLFLVWLDATAGLGDWDAVLNALNTGESPLEPALRELYVGRSLEALGKEKPATLAFERAARSPTEDRDLLFYLAGYFNQRDRLPLAEIVLRRLTSDPLASRSAYEALLNLHRVRGDTPGMLKILDEMSLRWPKDPAVLNDTHYLTILLDRDIARTLESSRTLAENHPDLFPLKMTHALALLRSGRADAALKTFERSPVEFGQLLPNQKAVFAALLKANGMHEAAESVRSSVDAKTLLPEERALIGK